MTKCVFIVINWYWNVQLNGWIGIMMSSILKICTEIRYDYSYNYVNPVYCVATVCHQVCCIYWGHLGHFRRAISHLKWYKIACMRYLACIFSQMKSINTFSIFLQSGVPRHLLWRFIAVWIYNLTVFMFMYVNVDLKLLRQYAETWVFGMLLCYVRQGNYILGLGNYHICSKL